MKREEGTRKSEREETKEERNQGKSPRRTLIYASRERFTESAATVCCSPSPKMHGQPDEKRTDAELASL